jgi:PPOX class probable F420-dependent enzyme
MASSDRTAGFGPLEGSKTALLTTFRRGGESVGTPLSIAVTGGKAYFVTAADSGKATRLAHTARVTLAPCTVSGKVSGDTVAGRARRLDPAERRQTAKGLLRPTGPLSGAWSPTGCSTASGWSCTRSSPATARRPPPGPERRQGVSTSMVTGTPLVTTS